MGPNKTTDYATATTEGYGGGDTRDQSIARDPSSELAARDPLKDASAETAALRLDEPERHVYAASELEGDAVVSANGEALGEVQEILLDIRSGRIAYALVASGGILGIGCRLHPVPWTALRLTSDHRRFVLDVTRSRFDASPNVERGAPQAPLDEHRQREIHEYYGARPYWE